MRILICGSSGLIGTAVAAALARDGHTIQKLVRAESKSQPSPGDVRWDPRSGELDAAAEWRGRRSQSCGRLDRRGTLDGRAQRAAAHEPRRFDAQPDSRAGKIREAAAHIRFRVGGRLFRRSRRRRIDGRKRRGRRFSRHALQGLGNGSGGRSEFRRAHSLHAFRNRSRARWRRAPANGDAIQTRRRRSSRLGKTVDVLGHAQRSGRHREIRHRERFALGRGQRRRAAARAQFRIHENSSVGPSPPRDFSRARLRTQTRARRNGRRLCCSPASACNPRAYSPPATNSRRPTCAPRCVRL